MVKHLPAMREARVRSLGWEDPLEEAMATHSSILAWKISWTEEWWATVHGVAESNTAEQLHFLFSFLNFKIEKYVVFFLLSGQSPASSIILLLWSFYY